MDYRASRFCALGGSIYAVQQSLLGKEETFSLWNLETLQWLRHYDGVLVESAEEDTDIFRHDASFFLHELGQDYVWFSCTNDGMEDMYVFHDRLERRYVLRYQQYTTFFLYSYEEMKLGALLFQRMDALEAALGHGGRG